MTARSQELLQGALQLPPGERAELAAQLLDSLDGETDPDAAEAWRAEVQRRVAELDQGRVQTIPWEAARQIILGSRHEPGR